MKPRTRPLALVLALPVVFLLTATPAGASSPTWDDLSDLFARGWVSLLSLWPEPQAQGSAGTAPTPIFGEEGCSIDPHGKCGVANSPVPILSEVGCELDPHGGCRE